MKDRFFLTKGLFLFYYYKAIFYPVSSNPLTPPPPLQLRVKEIVSHFVCSLIALLPQSTIVSQLSIASQYYTLLLDGVDFAVLIMCLPTRPFLELFLSVSLLSSFLKLIIIIKWNWLVIFIRHHQTMFLLMNDIRSLPFITFDNHLNTK